MSAEMFVVDDDEAVGRAVGRLLRIAGYRVRVFGSAGPALSAVRDTKPACLILDVHMPDCSGLEIWDVVHAEDAHIPVIFVTGHGDNGTVARAMKAGALEVLAKPFDADVLLGAVANAVGRKRP
jgi:FixJ family two-component response regulator